MKPPIISIEGDDVVVFSSTNDAQMYLEGFDIGQWGVFDSTGNRLMVSQGRYLFGPVIIDDLLPHDNQWMYVRSKIVGMLAFLGKSEERLREMPDNELLKVALTLLRK